MRLHVEGVMLRSPAREKEEDHGLWHRRSRRRRGAQLGDVGHRQPKGTNGPGLQESATVHQRMAWACRGAHGFTSQKVVSDRGVSIPDTLLKSPHAAFTR